MVAGVARGVAAATSSGGGGGETDGSGGANTGGTSSLDAVLDKVLDPRNWGLASVIVSGATRQALEAIIDAMREQYGPGTTTSDDTGGVNDALDSSPDTHFFQASVAELALDP